MIILFFVSSRLALGLTEHPFQWRLWTVFLEVKELCHEADRSCPSSPGAENEQSCTSTPHIHLHGMHRDSFTFLPN